MQYNNRQLLFITDGNCRTACLGWGGRPQFDLKPGETKKKIIKGYGKMSLQQLRKELTELKNSIITQYEPQFKIFIFCENGFTNTGEREEDFKVYVAAHPHTHVLKLIRKSCRKAL